ncbi:MAG: methyltransferase [Cyanobacteria bacterium J06659_2]
MRSFFELKIPPVAVITVFAVLMVFVTRLLPGITWLVPGRLVMAVALALLGGAVSLAGVAAFRQHRTTVNQIVPAMATTIVSSGPYRFTRNPMYVGFVLGLMW